MATEYKKELIGVVFGVLLGGLISFIVAFYNLNESFKLTQLKDTQYSLRVDIALLKNVESELDDNLNLFLNNDYKIYIQTEKLEGFKVPIVKEDEEDEEDKKEFIEYITQYYNNLLGTHYKVTTFFAPDDKFFTDSWEVSGPVVSNIDFELIQILNRLYKKLLKVNKFIDNINEISKDMTISESTLNKINNSVPKYNQLINDKTKKNIIEIKNGISSEINRLEKSLNKITSRLTNY